MSTWFGRCCLICMEEWDVNAEPSLLICCFRQVCKSCEDKIINNGNGQCPLCRAPKPNRHEALAHLRRHVENEIPEAIKHLGDCYQYGEMVVPNLKKAAKIYKRAVELGNTEAMVSLGVFYRNGLGVKVDKKKALQLTRLAADRGSALGQANLASDLINLNDIKGSFHYYKLAAEQGFTSAEVEIGKFYMQGVGREVDLAEARRWFSRAAAKDHSHARSRILAIDSRLAAASRVHNIDTSAS